MQFGIREAAFILLLLAMPVASYFFVFQPRAAQIAEARSEIAAKQAKLKELESATKSIENLGQEIDKLREAIDLWEQKLPAQRDVEVVLRDVWRLADENNLTPKSVRTDKIVTTSHYAELPLKMTIIGNFSGFYTFLQELEKLPRITRMPKMKLEKLDDEDDGTMQADIILSVFFENKTSRADAISRNTETRL
jgi:type IV pilus assembly protein PilO